MKGEVSLMSSQVALDIISDTRGLLDPKLPKLFFGVNHNFTYGRSRKITGGR